MPLQRRLFFGAVLYVFLFMLVELCARAFYPTLPSMVTSQRTAFTPAPAFQQMEAFSCNISFDLPIKTKNQTLLSIGDSIAAGVGTEHPYAYYLAEAFPTLALESIAQAGADLCTELGGLRVRLQQSSWPRVVVWEVFADDLTPYMVFSSGTSVFANPFSEPNAFWRAVATHSYLGNILWFKVALNYYGPQPRFVNPQYQKQITQSLMSLHALLSKENVAVIPFILEPAGWPLCKGTEPSTSPCHWMGSDLDLLNRLFQISGFVTLDLRGLWRQQALMIYGPEQGALPPKLVPIHPNTQGHQAMAHAILPSVEAQLRATQ